MPLKGENPITSYFPRLSPDAKLKTPIQSKPRLAKRARPPDEMDSVLKEVSRKKSKGQKHPDARECAALRTPSNSLQATSGKTPSAKDVIEINDTSPGRPMFSRQSTPPSSPLPDLTPSPGVPPRIRGPSHPSSIYGPIDDAGPTPSCEASYPEPREVNPDLIPSSQTQEIDYCSYENEIHKISQNKLLPSFSLSLRSPQTSSFIQPDTTPLEIFSTQEEPVLSSQSQFLDPIPMTPAIPDFDTIPSSQSQELFYLQHVYTSQKKGSDTSSQKRTSLLDIIADESEARAQSSEPGELSISGISPRSTAIDVEEPHPPTVIPSSSSQIPRLSSPDHEGERVPSSQLALVGWNDGEGSYESLPDVVRDFRGMFGDTFESLPPDFPMSLRF